MYEQMAPAGRCLPGLPICARLDGKNFSTLTKDMVRPFDASFHKRMVATAVHLVKQSCVVVGYVQSDEITLLFHQPRGSQVFFDGKVQKMVSVLAGMAAQFFGEVFDCRVWQVPSLEEAANAVLWRELDATKNSISSAARCFYSHKQLHEKTGPEMQEMLFAKGVNWNDYPESFRRGTYITRKTVWTKFEAYELERLPPKHAARANPDLEIERNVVEPRPSTPRLASLSNRVGFLFHGEEPVVTEGA